MIADAPRDAVQRQRGRRMVLYVGIALATWALAFGCYLVSTEPLGLVLGLGAVAAGCIVLSSIHDLRLLVRRGYREASRDANTKPMMFAFALMILMQGIVIGRTVDTLSAPKLGLLLFWPILFGILILPMARWKEWVTGEYFKRADAQRKEDA